MPFKRLVSKNEEELNRAERRILEAFDEAEDVDDTVWHSDGATLYDEICRIIEEEFCQNKEGSE